MNVRCFSHYEMGEIWQNQARISIQSYWLYQQSSLEHNQLGMTHLIEN